MILADDLRQLFGAELVGKRPWRRAIEPGGGEEIGRVLFGTRAHALIYSLFPPTGRGWDIFLIPFSVS
jgi:hypothetical protein